MHLGIGGMGWVLLWIWIWCRHCSNDCLLVQFKESTGGQEHTQSEVMSNFDTFIHQQCLPENNIGASLVSWEYFATSIFCQVILHYDL